MIDPNKHSYGKAYKISVIDMVVYLSAHAPKDFLERDPENDMVPRSDVDKLVAALQVIKCISAEQKTPTDYFDFPKGAPLSKIEVRTIQEALTKFEEKYGHGK